MEKFNFWAVGIAIKSNEFFSYIDQMYQPKGSSKSTTENTEIGKFALNLKITYFLLYPKSDAWF